MHRLQRKWRGEIAEMVSVAHRLADRGFVASHGGNISWKVNDQTILITPTQVAKSRLEFGDIVILALDESILYAGEGRKPTGETPLHLHLLKMRPELKIVIHSHPPLLTGFALARSNLLSRPFQQEVAVEIGPVVPIPFVEPVSRALAEAFGEVCLYADAFLMYNHGLTVVNRESCQRAMDLTEMLEVMASSLQVAHNLGGPVELNERDLVQLDEVRRRRNLPLPGGVGMFSTLSESYVKARAITLRSETR